MAISSTLFNNDILMWVLYALFSILILNKNISIYRNIKNIKNKVAWIYSNDNCQYLFVFMVSICHCCYCTISLYYVKLALFDEIYIIINNNRVVDRIAYCDSIECYNQVLSNPVEQTNNNKWVLVTCSRNGKNIWKNYQDEDLG